jgi:hypothetical protein
VSGPDSTLYLAVAVFEGLTAAAISVSAERCLKKYGQSPAGRSPVFWAILCFFISWVGWIIYAAAWRDMEKVPVPHVARSTGYGSPGRPPAPYAPQGFGSPPGYPPPGDQTAGYARDPAQQHELRFWNGLAWTDSVKDQGVIGKDAIQQ